MPRNPRQIVPELPHHITQRGARKHLVFEKDQDYELYLHLWQLELRSTSLRILAYVLMPNHVHLLSLPQCAPDLSIAMGNVHRRFSYLVNRERGCTGHLWQGPFRSFAMGEQHLYRATRYVLMNPVRANLVNHPGEWRYSSYAANLGLRVDPIIQPSIVNTIAQEIFLQSELEQIVARDREEASLMRAYSKTGEPFL